MNIGQLFIEAFQSLVSNKLRSGLTMLGIIIGVAAVIAMLAIGNGAQAQITNQINSIGSNLLYVSSGARNVRNARPLTTSDVAALSDPNQAPDVMLAAPIISGRASIAGGGNTSNTSVTGSTAAYATLRGYTVSEGSFITDANVTGHAMVAVIGADTATNLYNRTTNVVGQEIRIDGQIFKVIGVLTKKGTSSFGSQDDLAIVPITTAQQRLFFRRTVGQVDQILVQAASSNAVTDAQNEVTAILEFRHKITNGTDDFTILNQQQILDTANSIIGIFTAFLGGIGGISLLVGGIGVMNIMLVSVTERTREIGLRKALGARKRDILTQFLVESATMSVVGGAFGVLLGWGLATLIGVIASSSGTALTPLVSFSSIALATLFSAAVGLFFGIYPASRAASLAPVEALRSE
jgi:putative ABC transport system permease protein